MGLHGSGTIFFSGCNLACVFCQNYEISQLDQGTEVSAEGLATMMKRLQGLGCQNINIGTILPVRFSCSFNEMSRFVGPTAKGSAKTGSTLASIFPALLVVPHIDGN